MICQYFRVSAPILAAPILVALLAASAGAADMPFVTKAPPPAEEAPVEWGSNWYLRGDIGYQDIHVPVITGDFTGLINQRGTVSGGIGAGYQFNDWFRADLTVDRSVFRTTTTLAPIWCPTEMRGLYDQTTGDAVGIYADPNQSCLPTPKATLNRTSILANAYLDLGHFWGFTPYVGGGLGVSYNQTQASMNYYRTSDGALWAPDLTLPEGQVPIWINADGTRWPIQVPFAPTNWNRTAQKKSWGFAWNLMAGAAYDISDNLKIDVGYRYLNAGSYTSMPALYWNRGTVTQDITAHEVRVGLRVLAN